MYVDPNGYLLGEIGVTLGAAASAIFSVGLLYVVIMATTNRDALEKSLSDTYDAIVDFAGDLVDTITNAKVAEKEKEEVTSEQQKSGWKTYYHVTTPENAAAIMLSGTMVGSSWEGGYVFAWESIPSPQAIEDSGAHFGVIISFQTDAVFVDDPGLAQNSMLSPYKPVRSSLPGPINVLWGKNKNENRKYSGKLQVWLCVLRIRILYSIRLAGSAKILFFYGNQ